MKALHFGAGNIGRGFVGVLLHEAGYELVFADVADALIEQINGQDSYVVHEVGEGARDHEVTGFSGVNSASDLDGLREQIVSADMITTAVGPRVLQVIAPTIAEGLRAYQEERLVRGAEATRLSSTQFDQEMDANSRVVAGRPLEMLPQEKITI